MVRFRRALTAVAIAIGAFLVASHTPVDGPAAAPVPLPHKLTIVAFGSSSTQGVGASRQDLAYPAQLETLLVKAMPPHAEVKVLNRGIGGEDADDMAKRLDSDVIARCPDLVIWQTGSNDPMRHVPLDRFERETREGIAAMRAAGIEVMLMEPQWSPHLARFADAALYRDAVRRIGAEMNVVVVRRFDLMQDWMRRGLTTRCEMLAPDGLHMADRGYALLARWVASEVLRTQARKSVRAPTFVAAAGVDAQAR